MDPVIVNLTAGEHMLKVHLREDGTFLDKIALVPLGPVPTATNTPVLPTATNTPVLPTSTNTPVPPTSTNTPVP